MVSAYKTPHCQVHQVLLSVARANIIVSWVFEWAPCHEIRNKGICLIWHVRLYICALSPDRLRSLLVICAFALGRFWFQRHKSRSCYCHLFEENRTPEGYWVPEESSGARVSPLGVLSAAGAGRPCQAGPTQAAARPHARSVAHRNSWEAVCDLPVLHGPLPRHQAVWVALVLLPGPRWGLVRLLWKGLGMMTFGARSVLLRTLCVVVTTRAGLKPFKSHQCWEVYVTDPLLHYHM